MNFKGAFHQLEADLQVKVFEEFVVNGLSYKKIDEKYGFGAGRAKRYVSEASIMLWRGYKDCVLFPEPHGYDSGYLIHENSSHHVLGKMGDGRAFFPSHREVHEIEVRNNWPFETDKMREQKDIYAHVIYLYRADRKKTKEAA